MSVAEQGGWPERGLPPAACRWLAGVDRGLMAAALALSWFALHGWLRGEFWWSKFNVAGALFYGPAVYSMGCGRATVAGMALLIVLYTLFGVTFTLVARRRGVGGNLIRGVVWALGWHVLTQFGLWRLFDPFGPAYFVVTATLPAHLLAGLSLAMYGPRLESLERSFGNEAAQAAQSPPVPPSGPPPEGEPEAPDGEPGESERESDC